MESRPLRVLTIGSMYPPQHQGGYELVWMACVAELRRRGHEVGVLCCDHREPGRETEPEIDGEVWRELRWYWRDHEFPRLPPWQRLGLERENASALERRIGDLDPDAVIWFSMGGMSLSLIERVRRRGVPSLAVVCDDWLSYAEKADGWLKVAGSNRLFASAAERIGMIGSVDIAAGAEYLFLSDVLRRRAQLEHPSITGRVVHQPPDLDLFEPHPEAPWRGQLLYAGRIDPRKGIATAIRALSGLDSSTTLTIDGWGDPAHLDALRRLVAAEDVEDRVVFQRSAREQLPAVYADADVVVFPVAWEEPWGLVPLEAMATGTPVVATGMGGSGEYLDDGVNCLLFEPVDDAAALASAVKRLQGDPALRDTLRAGGMQTVRQLAGASFELASAAWVEAIDLPSRSGLSEVV